MVGTPLAQIMRGRRRSSVEIQGGAAVFDRVCAVTAVLSTHFANSPRMHLPRADRRRVVGSRSSANALALGRQT